MKATELRIGNYVFDCEGYVDKVTAIITPQIDNEKNCYPWLRGTTAIMLDNFVGAHTVDAIDPIPLSEEWLKKFGMKITDDEYSGGYDHEFKGVLWNGMVLQSDGSFYLFVDVDDKWYSFKWTELKYAHQLQNLYFVLTGNELTIQP